MRKVKPFKQYVLDLGLEEETAPVVDFLDEYRTPHEEKMRTKYQLSQELLEEDEEDEKDLDIMSQFTEEQPSSLAQPGITDPGEISIEDPFQPPEPVDLTRPDPRLDFFNEKEVAGMDSLKSVIEEKISKVGRLEQIMKDPEIQKDPEKFNKLVEAYNKVIPKKEIEEFNKIQQKAIDDKIKIKGLPKDVAESALFKTYNMPKDKTPPISMEEYQKELDPSESFIPIGDMKIPLDSNIGDAVGVMLGTTAGMAESGVGIWKRMFGDKPEDFQDAQKQVQDFLQSVASKNPDIRDDVLGGLTSLALFGGIGGVTAKTLQAFQKAGKVGQFLAKIGGLAGMTVAEAGIEAGSAYNEALADGKSEEEAKTASDRTMWQNLILIGVTNKLGFFSDKLKGAKKILASAPMEGIQEGGQYVINQINQGKEIDVDELLKTTAIGAFTGLVGGAVATEGMAPAKKKVKDLPQDKGVSPKAVTEEVIAKKKMEKVAGVGDVIPIDEGSIKDLTEEGKEPPKKREKVKVKKPVDQLKAELSELEERLAKGNLKKDDEVQLRLQIKEWEDAIGEKDLKDLKDKGLYQKDLNRLPQVKEEFNKDLQDNQLTNIAVSIYSRLEVPTKKISPVANNITNEIVDQNLQVEEKNRVLNVLEKNYKSKLDPKDYAKVKKVVTAKIDEAFKNKASLFDDTKPLGTGVIKKTESFKTDEGEFDVYDVEKQPTGRPNMFTVQKSPEGYVVRNAVVPENLQRKGIATELYTKLNKESLDKTGNPLRSSPERTLSTGQKVTELSPEGQKLWKSFVAKDLATEIGPKEFVFNTPEQQKQQIKNKKSNELFQKNKKELTVKVFTSKDIQSKLGKGKKYNKQYVLDLLKNKNLTQIEKDLVARAMSTQEGSKVDIDQLKRDVDTQLMPIYHQPATGFLDYGFREIQAPVQQGWSIVYNTPVIHGYINAVHFGEHYEKGKDYNVRHIPQEDTYIAIDRNMPENITDADAMGPYVGNVSNTREEMEKWLDNYRVKKSIYPKGTFGHTRGFDHDLKGKDARWVVEMQSDQFFLLEDKFQNWIANAILDPKNPKFHTMAEQFVALKNSWFTRMIKEEIDRAIGDGKSKIMFPTPRTVAYVEGYKRWGGIGNAPAIQDQGFGPQPEGFPFEGDLQVGDDWTHPVEGDDYIIVELLDNAFRAVEEKDVYSEDLYELAGEEADQRMSDIEYEVEDVWQVYNFKKDMVEKYRQDVAKAGGDQVKISELQREYLQRTDTPSAVAKDVYKWRNGNVNIGYNELDKLIAVNQASNQYGNNQDKVADFLVGMKAKYEKALKEPLVWAEYKAVMEEHLAKKPDSEQNELFPDHVVYAHEYAKWQNEMDNALDKVLSEKAEEHVGWWDYEDEGINWNDVESDTREIIQDQEYTYLSQDPHEYYNNRERTVVDIDGDTVRWFDDYGVDVDTFGYQEEAVEEEVEEDVQEVPVLLDEGLDLPESILNDRRDFSIKGMPEKYHKVLRLYDKTTIGAIKNGAGYDFELHTDKNGFDWYEVDLEGKPRKPLEAFQKQVEVEGKLLSEMTDEEVEKELTLAKKLLPEGVKVVLDPELRDNDGEFARGKVDLDTNTIYINPNLADSTTMIHEVSHKATELVVRSEPERASALLRMNGWDGQGDMMDFSNPSTVDAWEAIAEKAESYYENESKFMEEEAQADWYKVLFDKLRHLWEATGNMLKSKGFVSEAKFYDDLLKGNFRGGIVRSETGRPGMLFSADDKNLLAYHNLSASNLRHAIRMGGLAMPSVAISETKNPLTGFGEITLVANKDLIDPTLSRKNEIGRGDLYSSRYPTVHNFYNGEKERAYHQELKDHFGYRVDFQHNAVFDNLEYNGRKDIVNSEVIQLKYLEDNKMIKPGDYVYREHDPPSNVSKVDQKGFNDIQPDWKPGDYEDQYQYINTSGTYYDKFYPIAESIVESRLKEWGDTKDYRDSIYEDGKINRNYLWRLYTDLQVAKRDAIQLETNVRETVQKFKLDKDDNYQNHVDKIYDDLEIVGKVYKGDTPSGNRRYITHNLENILKDMKEAGGEDMYYGVGSVRAGVTERFKSVSEMKSEKDKLVTGQQFSKIKSEIDADFEVLSAIFHPHYKYTASQYDTHYSQDLGHNLALLARGRTMPDFPTIEDKQEEKARSFIAKLYNLPTEYFEANINRVVGIEEFEGALVPKDSPKSVFKMLEDSGILDIVTYDDPGDRVKKFAEFRSQLFQKKKLRKSKAERTAKEGVIPDLEKKPDIKIGEKEQPLPSINLDKINTEKDIQDLIEDTAKKHEKEIDKARRKKVPNKQLRESLKGMNFTDKDIDRIQKREPGGILNAEKTLAVRQIWEQAGRELLDYTKEIGVDPSDAQREQYQKLYSRFVALQRSVAGLRTEAGRLLQQWSVPTSGYGKDILDRVIKETAQLTTNDELTEFQKLEKLMEFASPQAKDKALWLWYNLLLSNPKTDMANIIGNVTHMAFEGLTRAVTENPATLAKGLYRGIKAGGREAFGVIQGKHLELRQGLFNEKARLKEKYGAKNDSELLAKATSEEIIVLKEMEKQLKTMAEMNKFVDPNTKRLDIHLFDLVPGLKGYKDSKLGKLINSLTPTTRLGIEDAVFRNIARGVEETVVAKKISKEYKKPIKQVEEDLRSILTTEDLTNDEYSKAVRKYAEGLENYISYTVFQQDLGEGGKKLGEAINKILPIKAIVPFYRIAVNLTKVGINTTPIGPLGMAFSKEQRENWKGKSAQERKHVIRRAVTGTALYAYLFSQIGGDDDGIEITGGGPTNPNTRELWEQAGYKPYSIVYTNDEGQRVLIPYRNINPLNVMLSVFGDYSDKAKYDSVDQENIDAITSGILSVATSLSDQSFMSGLSNFFRLLNNRSVKGAKRFAVSTSMPVRGLLGAGKTIGSWFGVEEDRTIYSAETMDEMMLKQLDMTETLPPTRTALGKVKKSSYERFPFPILAEVDPVAKYLLENDLSVSKPSKKVSGENLSNTAYQKYVKVTGTQIYKYIYKNIPNWEKYNTKLEDVDYEIQAELRDIRKDYIDKYLTK